ncbi:MAG: MarR family transcriptional regulator [Acidimicrobiales bacterium]
MSRTTAADLDLAAALRISVARLHRRLRAQRPDSGLSLTQIALLATLQRHGPASPTALAEHEKVQPPSMTRALSSLEARGLVDRLPHPSDRRQVLIRLTEQGEALLSEDRRRREAWLSQRLADLSTEELEALRAAAPVLERLAQS